MYYAPSLTTVNAFRQLCEAILRGERRWDSLKRIPQSIPGRYIHCLDLSHLMPTTMEAYGPSDYLLVNNCLTSILPLVPNLTSLKLPTDIGMGWSTIRALQNSPIAGQLRVLEGVRLQQGLDGHGQDPVVSLLRTMPNLEILGVSGLGSTDEGFDWDSFPQAHDLLDLPRLHTLTLKGIKHGLFISNLVRTQLPSLTHLSIASYASLPNDQTQELVKAHGNKLRSLTLLPTNEWPPVQVTPSTSVLSDCPNLVHLANRTVACVPPPATFAKDAVKAPHPLRKLTICRWSNSTSQADPSLRPDRVLQALHANMSVVVPSLRTIRVESFTWLRKDLGKAAMETGINGSLRRWSAHFASRGVHLVDKDGTTCPPMTSPGRRCSSGHQAGARFGMPGVGERRRCSMDDEDDEEGG
jgi:hypothetical protein